GDGGRLRGTGVARLGESAHPRPRRSPLGRGGRKWAVRGIWRTADGLAFAQADDAGGDRAAGERAAMMTVAQVQDRRRDELLHRQVGPLVLTLIGDRDVT